ncbi:MAG: hypothetical protein KDI13_09405 [Alphaproteobacteria bacterium]|nr:hypothetical protein [Alphaproteobacteria bacterium]
MAEPDLPRFAHFEGEKVTSLYDLYTRHAEVARDIHQDSLRRFTGNNALTVDLVRESPIVPENADETIRHMQEYDVVSVSSGVAIGSVLHSSGVAGLELADKYRHVFAEQDMPVYVVAAGNEGLSKQTVMARVADFARNSLVVGEANMNSGSPYVEEHSSRINPTVTSDSPFNRGERYQFYNVSPSLEGHEDLIREWIIDKEIDAAFEAYKVEHKDENLDDRALSMAYLEISRNKHHELEETEEGRARVKAQVDGYMANPETLHSQIMAEFRQNRAIDANGYVTDLDGTSFSAPEQAGYISGALYEQTQREENNRPILTKDEITTLAKMATTDTTAREGQTDPMYSHTNADGQTFVAGGGHGVFQPQMFRALLDEAYKRIETNPDIDRNSVTAVMSGNVGANHKGTDPVTLRSNLPEGSNMVIDRMRLDLTYSVNGSVPHEATIKPSGAEPYMVGLQEATSSSMFTGWSRDEYHFGEGLRAGQNWEVSMPRGKDATVRDAQITVYGYNQGGLMDQMMDYSKELAAKMAPKPEVDPAAPALDNAIDQSIPPENRLTADPPPGPR